jgi:Tfp pilus assembly protein PilN
MAAARVDGIDRLMRALSGANLRAECIQLSGLAMLRALEHPPLAGQAILYVQAGALTNVVIAEDGEPLLVRAASAGSEAIAQGLAERTQISHEEARAHIAALGVRSAPHHGAPATVSPELEAAVSLQVREGLRRVVAEIQSSRGFYSARPDARPIGAVVLTGAMTTWPGVVETLTRELHLPVLPAGRDAWPDLDGVTIAPERLDIAIGLALSTGGQDERPDLRPVTAAKRRTTSVSTVPVGRIAKVSCASAALLAAGVVYLVTVTNQANSGREKLGTLATQLVASEQQAAELKPYADFVAATTTRRDAVASVAKTRFKWDRTLTELAKVAPSGVWLTSVDGKIPPAAAVAPAAAGAAAAAPVAPQPTIALKGCASTERGVPAYIDRLELLTGVTTVGFTRSERLDKKAAAQGAGGLDDCRGGDPNAALFDLTTAFKAPPALPVPTVAPSTGQSNAVAVAASPAAPPNQSAAIPTGGAR